MSLPKGPRRPTIREVAVRAEVSIATVSRVLAGIPGAGPEVRERVLATVEKLGYTPDLSARSLRARHRKLIGLMLPDLQNPFFTGLAHGVEEILSDAGFTLLLGHSDGQPQRERRYLDVFRGEGMAGLVFVPGNRQEADYSKLRSWNLPVVAVDRGPRGLDVDLVKTDNRGGARDALRHLIKLGFRDLAMINGPEGLDVSAERLAGALEAVAEAGLPRDILRVVHSDFHLEGGIQSMNTLLAATRRPRALLVANNLMTLGALQVLHERGVRIPDDLALVSFDDMPWAASLRPALTAVSQPAEELGRTAAGLLLDRLAEPSRTPRQVILRSTLIVRSSCGAHARPPLV